MIRRPPRSTLSSSSAASDVYKRQLWNGDVLCKCTGTVHSQDLEILADLTVACVALIAVPAVNMCLGTDKVAFLESTHGPACLHDVPGEFVAHDMRSLDPVLCPFVPYIDVDICATDRGIIDLD